MKEKLIKAVIPAFLLAISVGQIYAFTNFSTAIADYIGESKASVQFAFSIGILWLGLGAAFFGKIVEKNIKLSSIIGTSLFIGGLLITNLGINIKSLLLIYLGYGFMLGLGTGVIYISPVKTMMMWFPNKKAIAAAFPIISFGLGSTLSTILYGWIEPMGITKAFAIYSIVYLPMMALGCLLLKKPKEEVLYGGFNIEQNRIVENGINQKNDFSYRTLLKDEFFIRSWAFMFLNISCGLMLIPLAKQVMSTSIVGYGAMTISVVVALSGIFNGCGRFVFAAISDMVEIRRRVLRLILIISSLTMVVSFLPMSIGLSLLIINACYGAGFSVIPGILAEHYGMDNISKIHGAVLSAWGIAGIVGNQVSIFVSDGLGLGYFGVIGLLLILYLLNLRNVLRVEKI